MRAVDLSDREHKEVEERRSLILPERTGVPLNFFLSSAINVGGRTRTGRRRAGERCWSEKKWRKAEVLRILLCCEV